MTTRQRLLKHLCVGSDSHQLIHELTKQMSFSALFTCKRECGKNIFNAMRRGRKQIALLLTQFSTFVINKKAAV